jgi:hypothetical protein
LTRSNKRLIPCTDVPLSVKMRRDVLEGSKRKKPEPPRDLGLPRYTYSRTANVESLNGDKKKAAE